MSKVVEFIALSLCEPKIRSLLAWTQNWFTLCRRRSCANHIPNKWIKSLTRFTENVESHTCRLHRQCKSIKLASYRGGSLHSICVFVTERTKSERASDWKLLNEGKKVSGFRLLSHPILFICAFRRPFLCQPLCQMFQLCDRDVETGCRAFHYTSKVLFVANLLK